MKIVIDNFRGISHAEIETGTITALCGNNGQGKTSIIQGIAAALTGQTSIINGLPKSSLGMLVHSGTAAGSITVRTETGSVQVDYPAGTRTADGTVPEISEYAAGLKSLLDYKEKERVEIINQMLDAYPTNDDLVAELLKVKAIAAPEQAKRLTDTVSVQGWDAAHAQAKESGAKLKGRWEEVTQQNWGTKIAATWAPPAWSPDLESETVESLKNQLAQEEEFLKAAESDVAINADRLARLQHDASRIPNIQSGIDERKNGIESLLKNQNEIQAALDKLPELKNSEAQVCPHCNGSLVVIAGRISTPVTYTDQQIADRKAARMESELSIDQIKKQIESTRKEIDALGQEMYAAQRSKQEYESMAKKPTGTGDGKSVDEIKARVESVRAKIDAKQRKESADKIASDVARNQLIVDVLDKDGLRKRKLAEKLGDLNIRLQGICAIASWRDVAVKPDMSITYGGSPYMLVSESEKYRTRIALQLAVSGIQAAPMVLIDGAEILDPSGRTGLFKTLVAFAKAGTNSVVAMTATQFPRLDQVGGRSYMVKNGTVEVDK